MRRHREDDRLDAAELLLVHLVEPFELLAHARNHLQHALERPHAAQHLVALEEVVEGELALHHPALDLFLLVVADRGLRALDEREHVAHPEDARRHPVGMEPLERVELLADRRELDRAAGDVLHRQRRAAARIAVELRHEDAVEVDALLERLRDIHRLLARHRVEDEEHVRRLRLAAHGGELLHQRLVHVQAPGCVEDDDVAAVRLRALDAVTHGLDRVGALVRVDRDADLLAELHELVDRGRALEVGGDERGLLVVLLQEERQLAGGGRLAGALKAGEEDRRRRPRRERELRRAGAHEGGELVVDDLHHLLAGRQALADVLAQRTLAHVTDELARDLEVDVRLEQG